MSRLLDEQAVVETMSKWLGYRTDAEQYPLRELLSRLPSAQPKRKRGRLEYVDYGGFGNWHCTACRKIIICNGDYDFCPYCGADLREGEE